MSVATDRTARYGGASSTFTTAASPGGALTALFGSIDAVLVAAGWTRLVNTGSPGPNTYSSTGESGTEKLFLTMTTAAFGTTTGTDLSGGSGLILAPQQWADGSGNYCNRLGVMRVTSTPPTPSTSVGCLALTASTTYEWAILASKDGIWVVASTSGTSTAHQWAFAGNLQRNPSAKAFFTTTNTVANGSSVTVNLSGNPITAGYLIGDIVTLIGQQAGASTATTGDIVASRIVSMTSSSMTLDVVTGLSQTLSTGALIGEDPQPFCCYTIQTSAQNPENTPGRWCHGPLAPVAWLNGAQAGNLWTQQISSGAVVGGIDSASLATFVPGTLNLYNSPSGWSTTNEKRCNAFLLGQARVSAFTGAFGIGGFVGYSRGFLPFLYRDQRTAGNQTTTGLRAREMQTSNEYVNVVFNTNYDWWLGPFPETIAPETSYLNWVRKVNSSDIQIGELLVLNDNPQAQAEDTSVAVITNPTAQAVEVANNGDSLAFNASSSSMYTEAMVLGSGSIDSSDDEQPLYIDRIYPFDYGAPGVPSISNSPNSGSTILNNDPITITVTTSNNNLTEVIIYAKEGPSRVWELAIDNITKGVAFSTSVVGTNTPGLKSYTIYRDGGWRDASIQLLVVATNDAGGSVNGTLSYTVSNPVVIYVPGHSNLNIGMN